jgi:hypothetical protein
MVTDKYRDNWEKERKAFNRLLPKLLKIGEYRNKYVLICDGRIVDYDINEHELYKRASKLYKNTVFFIGKVTDHLEITYLLSQG